MCLYPHFNLQPMAIGVSLSSLQSAAQKCDSIMCVSYHDTHTVGSRILIIYYITIYTLFPLSLTRSTAANHFYRCICMCAVELRFRVCVYACMLRCRVCVYACMLHCRVCVYACMHALSCMCVYMCACMHVRLSFNARLNRWSGKQGNLVRHYVKVVTVCFVEYVWYLSLGMYMSFAMFL
jgi:hypothetical protein